MKKILVVSQYYYPEQFSITHICEELVKKGYKVSVVTGNPNYPMGEIYDGYDNTYREECINGVQIIRVPITPRKRGMIRNYYSYAKNAAKKIKSLEKDFDVILVYEVSPITQVIPALVYKRRVTKDSKLVIYCQDIWPEVLIGTGFSEKSIIYKVGFAISKKLYKSADQILITSKLFAKYLWDEFRIDSSIIQYLPSYRNNWVLSIDNIKPNDNKIHLVFAGNMGKGQNLDLLIEAVSQLESKDNLVIDMVGDGSEYENLVNQTKRLGLESVVIFHGRKSGKELEHFYCIADAFLILLRNKGRLNYTVPAKLQGYMGAGKPILACIEGGAKDIIEEAECGIVAENNDSESFARVIDTFVENSCNYVDMGMNGRRYFQNNYTEEIYFSRLCNFLDNLE